MLYERSTFSVKNGMWKGKDIFSAKMTGVKRRELDPGLSFLLIEDLPGEFTIIIIYQFVTWDTEKCSFSILTRLTYEKRTIRFTRVFVLSEMAGVHCISSTTIFC